ncbi:hypothetical protein KPA97_06520 [Burkholderia cenocepacia]|nr:hypothetical protein [Burkholderia cenocepacia]
MQRATKIVATIGPASSSPEILLQMMQAGLDVVRLNFSHGTADQYEVGTNPPSFDKQFVRDWLEAQPWGKTAPAPALPADVVEKTAAKYQEALERITGQSLA